jgi:hypothetical protein
MTKKLTEYIQEIESELDSPFINKQRKRHLIDELEQLREYQTNHPAENETAPNSLELYCDKNPEAVECRIFNL